jgi:hypothetical protein
MYIYICIYICIYIYIYIGKQAAETSAVAADAQKDLDRALPALESAVKALKGLTKVLFVLFHTYAFSGWSILYGR